MSGLSRQPAIETCRRRVRGTASVIGGQSEDDRESTRPRRHSMGDELATSNVNRSHSLAATSIAIFTFMLFFLYPRFARGEINALLFQVMIVVMGVATFSFVFASFHYYCSSIGSRIDDAERALYSRRGDRFWLLGYTLLFLGPSLILFSVGLLAVGSAWFALWLVYLLFVIRHFARFQTARTSSSRGDA
jgi:Flp pilus assembly protein TadB